MISLHFLLACFSSSAKMNTCASCFFPVLLNATISAKQQWCSLRTGNIKMKICLASKNGPERSRKCGRNYCFVWLTAPWILSPACQIRVLPLLLILSLDRFSSVVCITKIGIPLSSEDTQVIFPLFPHRLYSFIKSWRLLSAEEEAVH